jgi:hypothetical protein
MAIDFPASPTLNDVFTVGNVTYVWDGTKWTASVTGGISLDKIEEGNTSAEVIDTGSDGRFVVTTEGSERLRVTDTGLVGIGTNNPGSRLEIGGDPSYDARVTFNRVPVASNDNVIGELFFQNNADSVALIAVKRESAADDAYIQFATQQTGGGLSERARITSAGLVGIGTSSPVDRLHVDGRIAVSTDSSTPTTGEAFFYKSSTGAVMSGFGATIETGGAGSRQARVSVDSSGRVGIGTTSPGSIFDVKPSASSSTLRIEAGTINTDSIRIQSGGTANTYLEYRGYLGHAWFVDITERARIDSSGRLLVGTSSAVGVYGLQIEQAAGSPPFAGSILLRRGLTTAEINATGYTLGAISAGSQTDVGGSILFESDAAWGSGDYPTRLVFATTADGASSPTERMRIGSDGTSYFQAPQNVVGAISGTSAGTSNRIYYGSHSGAGLGGTISYTVWTNGNVVNTNNSYGALSDIKLKENIVDAHSQWADLKSLQVRNYNFKEGQTHTQLGLIAQEAELVSPGLVYESPDRDKDGKDLGTVTKSVNYSVLYMKAVKALQEAMERIETLEGMVAVNNITIDEQQHQLSTLAARLTALESA